jgi:phage major head subunit gpT-like protein
MKLFPRLRKWIGERKINNLVARGQVLVNDDYEDTVGIDKNQILDDQIGVFSQYLAMMGSQAALWPCDLVVAAMQAGDSTACFDGQNFFSTAHPVDSDNTALGTYANLYTTTPLSASNYQTVRAAMRSQMGEDGKPINVNPGLLVVPPQLEATALQILNAEMIAPAAAFGQNAVGGFQTNVLRGSANLLVIPELSNAPTNWYLLDVSKPIKPFVFQLRQAPEMVQLFSPTDENVFFRREYIYGVHARGAAGYALPFLAAAAQG